MFNLNETMCYYLCPEPVSMRKGIHSLCGVVHEQMGCEIKNGDVFVFVNGGRKLMKLLHAEDGGMVMYVKRLEAGRFRLPVNQASCKYHKMDWQELFLMVEGIVPPNFL